MLQLFISVYLVRWNSKIVLCEFFTASTYVTVQWKGYDVIPNVNQWPERADRIKVYE